MTDTTATLPVLHVPMLPIGSIDAYIHQINQIPMLSDQEEQELAERLQKSGDLYAAQRMVLSHLRYVVRVAKGYMGYGLALADLIQEGSVGLMKAVKRFQPDKGVRLVSFAVHWIKAEIHEFIIKNWRIVKIATTKAQRKLFFKLRGSKKSLGWFSNDEVHAVAQDLGVKPAEVLHMEQRLNAKDTPFELPTDTDSNDNFSLLSPVQYLEAENADPALLLEHNDWRTRLDDKLHQALQSLDLRSQDIIQKRWLNEQKSTLHELASEHKVSPERIRQLEKNAMNKLIGLLKPEEAA